MVKYKAGDTVRAIFIDPIGPRTVAPPLELNQIYVVKDIIQDSKGYQHIDVGLVSKYNFIESVETGEELDRGEIVHWCHPSRFELA